MKNIDAVKKVAESPESVTWGKKISAVTVAALVAACFITVGCSSDKPKPSNSTSQIPMTPPQLEAPNPVVSSSEISKTAPKKVAKKHSATRIYKEKTYGVSFSYPRKYGVETGDAANEIIASSPVSLTSSLPGGIALAAVELPEASFPNSDFSSAFFGVSVNKAISSEQCKFPEKTSATDTATQQKIEAKPVAVNVISDSDAAQVNSTAASTSAQPAPPSEAAAATQASSTESSAAVEADKLKIGDAELLVKESVSGAGARQSDAKYYRTFQNGACYEFALNVTTEARDEAGMKHVDRDRVFSRLEKILATMKINDAKETPVAKTEIPASEKTGPPAVASAETPHP
jgi:hypothetical protein